MYTELFSWKGDLYLQLEQEKILIQFKSNCISTIAALSRRGYAQAGGRGRESTQAWRGDSHSRLEGGGESQFAPPPSVYISDCDCTFSTACINGSELAADTVVIIPIVDNHAYVLANHYQELVNARLFLAGY